MIKYPFEVYKTVREGHICWVAKSTRLKGCMGQGTFLSDSLSELARNEEAWLKAAVATGVSVPLG